MSHRLYVGTIGEGLFRSTDGGETFRRACDGMFVECQVRALAVDPRDDRLLYLGNELGLFRSTDGADSWSAVESPLQGLQVWSILLHPRKPDTLFVGTCPSRLFRSEDGGRSWTELQARIEPACPRIMHTRVTTLAVDPTDAETIWAGVEIDGLRRSRDGGRTWETIRTGLSSQDIHALAIVATPAGKRMLATTNNDVNLSSDDGVTWQPLDLKRDLPWSYFRGLAQKSGTPGTLFLGHGDLPPGWHGLILRSTDAGQTWERSRMPGIANSTIWSFAIHRADPEQVYASSVSGQIYRSNDGGATWLKLATEFGEIRALAWTPG